jgi:putative oxidoreductase
MADTNTATSSGALSAVSGMARSFLSMSDRLASPIFDLLLRIYVFRVFFYSGWKKVTDFESAEFLFEYEWALGVLPPDVWAVLAITFEVGASVLVLIGLFARFAAIPLLAMAMVIQFWLGAVDPAYYELQHFAWMLVLLSITLRGPGAISLDRFIAPWLANNKALRD